VTAQPQSSSKLPLILSLAVVVICVALGGGFIWWYLREGGGSSTVKLSQQDLTAMQSAGQQLTFRQNGGTPTGNPFGVGRGGPPVLRIRTAPDPDGIFSIANFEVIRAGQTLVRVQASATAGAPPTLVFRQRTWGLLQDAASFTIARRIVHEAALAHQLAVTNDQMIALAKIVATPPLKGTYLSGLPVPDSDEAVAVKAWTDYQAASTSNDTAKKAQGMADLLKSMRAIGAAAMTDARTQYSNADAAITQILSAEQVQAYRQGKSLAAP
jgi:hypothetical protein